MSLVDRLNAAFGGDWTSMAGTDRTFEYTVVLGTDNGRIGHRQLPGGEIRVRVEPAYSKTLEGLDGWKQPDSTNHRYSAVAADVSAAKQLISQGVAVLKKEAGSIICTNKAQDWIMPDEEDDWSDEDSQFPSTAAELAIQVAAKATEVAEAAAALAATAAELVMVAAAEAEENAPSVLTGEQLAVLSRQDLRALLRERGVSVSVTLSKQTLIERLLSVA